MANGAPEHTGELKDCLMSGQLGEKDWWAISNLMGKITYIEKNTSKTHESINRTSKNLSTRESVNTNV